MTSHYKYIIVHMYTFIHHEFKCTCTHTHVHYTCTYLTSGWAYTSWAYNTQFTVHVITVTCCSA